METSHINITLKMVLEKLKRNRWHINHIEVNTSSDYLFLFLYNIRFILTFFFNIYIYIYIYIYISLHFSVCMRERERERERERCEVFLKFSFRSHKLALFQVYSGKIRYELGFRPGLLRSYMTTTIVTPYMHILSETIFIIRNGIGNPRSNPRWDIFFSY